MWPFDFSLIYTVKLAADAIETKLRIQNVGDKTFDFNTLLHTYFLIPVRSRSPLVLLSSESKVVSFYD